MYYLVNYSALARAYNFVASCNFVSFAKNK